MKPILRSCLGPVILLGVLLAGCQTPSADNASASPVGVTWQLVELQGVAVPVADNPRHPSLQLNPATQRVTGHAGVNGYGGAYEMDGTSLKFGLLMSTMMAGPEELMALEQRYTAMLGQVTGWRLTPAGLDLLEGDTVVARYRRLAE